MAYRCWFRRYLWLICVLKPGILFIGRLCAAKFVWIYVNGGKWFICAQHKDLAIRTSSSSSYDGRVCEEDSFSIVHTSAIVSVFQCLMTMLPRLISRSLRTIVISSHQLPVEAQYAHRFQACSSFVASPYANACEYNFCFYSQGLVGTSLSCRKMSSSGTVPVQGEMFCKGWIIPEICSIVSYQYLQTVQVMKDCNECEWYMVDWMKPGWDRTVL